MPLGKNERLKRGAVRDDGKIFWAYFKHLPKGEYWVTPERYKSLRDDLDATRKRLRSNPEYLAREYRGARRRKVQLLKDPFYRFQHNIGTLIRKTIRDGGYSKESRSCEILGCSFEFFKAYIEQRFLPGMGWHNRSEWHLDHIIPVSSAKTERELLKLNRYTNFRPLWAKDNLSKKNKTNEQLTLLAA
jgi:hypothetical protein